LQQIIWNLLSNAIKFTPRKGAVRIELEQMDSNARIVVSDTGAGIKAEFLPYVFDRFRQQDSSYTRQHGGLGLGLAIVRHLVETHGGTVRAESEGEGKGATFVVSMPLLKDEGRAISNERRGGTPHAFAHPPPSGSRALLGGLWLLVVDDEPDALELISAVLERYGATVTVVGSAAGALEVLARCEGGEWPDAMLSDIGMAGEDGLYLIRRVRAMEQPSGATIPAIALTAYARADDRARALEAGFQVHVAKPFEPAQLVGTIASLVQQTRKGFSN
jgi:CheY-like chemotaxis protein/anti-sigma regulatory factor (Ser/Thr protein kinase)